MTVAQRIVTICDQHAQAGDDRPGTTWTIGLRERGGQLQTWDVDACPECAQTFVDLAAYLAELGRPVGKPHGLAKQTDPDAPVADRTCPACGYVSVNRKAMRSHLWAQHKERLANYAQPGQPHPSVNGDGPKCPECGRQFERVQGLGVHRARKHGVPGPSKQSQAYRARQAAS